jgi:hypothetical protein
MIQFCLSTRSACCAASSQSASREKGEEESGARADGRPNHCDKAMDN